MSRERQPPGTAAKLCLRLDDMDGANAILTDWFVEHGDQGIDSESWSLRLVGADVLRLRRGAEVALAYLANQVALYPPDGSDAQLSGMIKKHRGYYLGLLGKYVPSHGLMREAENLAEAINSLELTCEVYQCQAMIYYLQRDYISSDRIFRQILDASHKLGGWYFKANALWGIGKNLMIQSQYSEAIPWLNEALDVFESVNARLSVATTWGELAVCYSGLGDDRRALALLKDALKIEAEAGTIGNYQVGLANIGNVYFQRGDPLTAISYYRRALELAREIKDPVSIEKWSHNIRVSYAKLCNAMDLLDSRTV